MTNIYRRLLGITENAHLRILIAIESTKLHHFHQHFLISRLDNIVILTKTTVCLITPASGWKILYAIVRTT